VLFVAFIFRSIADADLAKKAHRSVEIITPKRDIIAPKRVGIPSKLTIPTIGVDGVIYAVGMAADGTMDIRKDPKETAWYSPGPRPGEKGSAVIAGHYGWDKGVGSIFNNLHTLKQGDEVSVDDDKGNTHHFIVRESRSYDPAADATAVFKSTDDKSHLNLITCEGNWSEDRQTYSQRLVVFTDLKE